MKTTAVSENFVRLNFGTFQIDVLSLKADWITDQSNDCSSAPPFQHQFESTCEAYLISYSDYTVLKGYKPSQNVVWPEYYSYE